MLCALCLSLLLSFTGLGQSKNFDKLVGRWEIVSEDGEKAYLEVIDSMNIHLTYQGETRKCLNPRINFSKSPIWFDFTTGEADSAVRVQSLVEIFDSGIIKWQLFVDEERSPHFTASRGEILYMRKSKPAVINTAKAQ